MVSHWKFKAKFELNLRRVENWPRFSLIPDLQVETKSKVLTVTIVTNGVVDCKLSFYGAFLKAQFWQQFSYPNTLIGWVISRVIWPSRLY